jgi:hypothetical protein
MTLTHYKGCTIRQTGAALFIIVTPSGHTYEAKSLHAAKYRITKFWSTK